MRDYIHISDVVEAFVRAVDYSGSKRVFNISSGIGASLNELLGVLEKVLAEAIVPSYLPARPFDVPVSVLSNDLAREELKWAPSITMLDGIAKTVDWMKGKLA